MDFDREAIEEFKPWHHQYPAGSTHEQVAKVVISAPDGRAAITTRLDAIYLDEPEHPAS
jgi:hypothetical protein